MTTPQSHHLRSYGVKPKKPYDDKAALQRKYKALAIEHEKLKRQLKEIITNDPKIHNLPKVQEGRGL